MSNPSPGVYKALAALASSEPDAETDAKLRLRVRRALARGKRAEAKEQARWGVKPTK